MNLLASESSSGCESGWTLYLEQSFLTPDNSHNFADPKNGFCGNKKNAGEQEVEEEEEEEDSSMVSDASSGPPHFNEDEGYFNNNNHENGYFYPAFKDTALVKNGGHNRHKLKEHRKDQEMSSFLDDTASSTAFNFSKNNFSLGKRQSSRESALDHSQGFSATHFEGRSAYQEHYSYMHPSLPGNQLQNNQYIHQFQF